MQFSEQKRYDIHIKMHLNKKPKKSKSRAPDFEKPRFDQVM